MALGRLLAGLLEPLGVDRGQFLALLEARVTANFAHSRREEAAGRPAMLTGNLLMTLVMHLLFGACLAALLYEASTPRLGLFWVFGVTMAMVTMTLMSEHAATLFETNDLVVVGPLPVTGRTVLAARVAHTLTYFLLLVGTLGLFPLLAGVVRLGPAFAPAFLLALLLGTVTCLALAIALLVLALRFVAASQVRSVLLLVQILGSSAAVLGWQLIPMTMQLDMQWLIDDESVWAWLLPAAHCASLVMWLIGDVTPAPLGQALLALLVPIYLLAFIAVIAGRFHDKLIGMLSAERRFGSPPKWRLGRDLLLRDPEAKLGYDFAAAMVARENVFVMRVWPTVIVFWLFAAWSMWRASNSGVASQPALACAALYMVGLLAPQVLNFARFSEHWPARQVFRTGPLQRPGQVVAGALLALLMRFCVPATALTFVVTLALGGLGILWDAVFALLAVAVATLIALRTEERRLPFTEKLEQSKVQGSVIRSLLMCILVGVMAIAHSVLRATPKTFVASICTMACLATTMFLITVQSLRHPDHLGLTWRDEGS